MSRLDLSTRMALKYGMSKKEARKQLDQVLEFLVEEIEQLPPDEKLVVRGFGTFMIRDRKARIRKVPKTGANVYVSGYEYPHFKFATSVKTRIRQRD